MLLSSFFFFNDTATTEIYTLSLHDALPIFSGALITTVTALCVAIPAMFGYNFLVTSIRGIIVEMDNFAAELASEFEHKYVDHGSRLPAVASAQAGDSAVRRLDATPNDRIFRRSARST